MPILSADLGLSNFFHSLIAACSKDTYLVIVIPMATVGPAGGAQWCAGGETAQGGEDGHETRQAVYGEWACTVAISNALTVQYMLDYDCVSIPSTCSCMVVYTVYHVIPQE